MGGVGKGVGGKGGIKVAIICPKCQQNVLPISAKKKTMLADEKAAFFAKK